jgi:hypothetical protein
MIILGGTLGWKILCSVPLSLWKDGGQGRSFPWWCRVVKPPLRTKILSTKVSQEELARTSASPRAKGGGGLRRITEPTPS